VSCLYWDEPSQTYSSDGCAAQPNPAPAGASLFWKNGAALPRDVNGTVLLDEAWSLGGWGISESDRASDSNSDWGSDAFGLLEGCEETFAAYFDEYEGADAGLRKFVGEGCELSRTNNTAMCWWDWRRQTFTGSGCVLAETLQCMCTHLTDFQAGMNMGTGELKVPDVAIIDPGAMTSLSLADVAASGRLLTVVGTLIGTAVLGFILSNWLHNRTRLRILRSLVFTAGRASRDSLWFKELKGGVWSWNLDDEVEDEEADAAKPAQTVRAAWDAFKKEKQQELKLERRKSIKRAGWGALIGGRPGGEAAAFRAVDDIALPESQLSTFMQVSKCSRY
jgi:hypothetical protein